MPAGLTGVYCPLTITTCIWVELWVKIMGRLLTGTFQNSRTTLEPPSHMRANPPTPFHRCCIRWEADDCNTDSSNPLP